MSARRLEPGNFYGINRKALRVGGVILSETIYRPDLAIPRHIHELPYFGFLAAGAYQEEYGRRRVVYGSRSVVFQPPHEARWGEISSHGATLFHIELEPSWLSRVRAETKIPTDAIDYHCGKLVALATELYREFRYQDEGSGLILEGITLEMLGAILRHGRRNEAPTWLASVVERLHEEYHRSLSVTGIAEELDLSPVRLSRTFRKHFGESVGTYLQRIRVEEVTKQLADPTIPLANIALDTGFSDQSHLTRVFKRVTGIPPGTYRRRLQETRKH